MSEEELKKAIERGVDGAAATVQKKGRLVAAVSKAGAVSALILLKARGFGHLSAISCTDWLEDGEFELVYHLWSYRDKIHVMLKTRLPRANPQTVTASPVFRHAQTYEREIHEMYGVHFEGNPRLTPLLLDHWQGPPPMRRDFDTRQYVEDTFGSTSPVEE
jgi:NADH-quinone oxidoreductase subunit C